MNGSRAVSHTSPGASVNRALPAPDIGVAPAETGTPTATDVDVSSSTNGVVAPPGISKPGGGASPVKRIRGSDRSAGRSSTRRAWSLEAVGPLQTASNCRAVASMSASATPTTNEGTDRTSMGIAADSNRTTGRRARPGDFPFTARDGRGRATASLRRTQPRPSGSWAGRRCAGGTGRARASSCVRRGGRHGWPGRPARVGDGSERSRRCQTMPGSETGRTPRREESFFMDHQGTAKTAPAIWLREPARCNPPFHSGLDIFPTGSARTKQGTAGGESQV